MRPPLDVSLVDFNRAPFLVIWEVTRACALACVHCRADAIPCRDALELSTEEGFRLIDQVRAFGPRPSAGSGDAWRDEAQTPLFVLTGGDPMRRPDLADLVKYAASAGLTVALTPSGTAAATRRRLEELKEAGLSRVAVSLDGPDPETHDAFRRVRGSYAWTMRIVEAAIDLGLPLQINTTVSRLTLAHLEAMARRVADWPLALWAVFFLVQTGRGASLDQIDAQQCERVLNFLYDLSLVSPFGIKTTEAPYYNRVIWQREHSPASAECRELVEGQDPVRTTPPLRSAERRRHLRAPRSVNDGNGFVFVDHVGSICPSGFLPVTRGNVRRDRLADVYRTDEVFVRLRNADALLGKCGRCQFRAICGGSRSRAFAATGAVMASDPLCAYEPGPDIEPLVQVEATLKTV